MGRRGLLITELVGYIDWLIHHHKSPHPVVRVVLIDDKKWPFLKALSNRLSKKLIGHTLPHPDRTDIHNYFVQLEQTYGITLETSIHSHPRMAIRHSREKITRPTTLFIERDLPN